MTNLDIITNKVYCTHENLCRTNGILVVERGIYRVEMSYNVKVPVDLGRIILIAECNKPSVKDYKDSKKQCEECLAIFKAPWTDICESCHSDVSDYPYKNWKWVKKLVIDYQNKCLTYFES